MNDKVARRLAVLLVLISCLGPTRTAAQPGELTRLKNPSPNVPTSWLTKAERTNFVETPRYDETVAFCRRLADASKMVAYRSFGLSPEGRDLPLVIASSDGAFTPAAARKTGKLVVFIQNCIHAGECEGKDASLMLLRDIAITKTRKHLLDNITLIVVPIFNVDGHERFSPYSRINQNGPKEMGWRVTSRNLNLNRDYIKADAVEMRAWLALWNEWQPDLHFDNHTTNGGDWQYDITFDSDTHATAAPAIARWVKDELYPPLFAALKADGHVPAIYSNLLDSKDPAKGVRSGGFTPRFSTGYASIRNRPSILVETHMLKPYRTRVICHYNIMLHTLEALNRKPAGLTSAIKSAEANTIALGKDYQPKRELALTVRTTDETTPYTFKGFAYRHELSDVSGALRIIYDNTKPMAVQSVRQGTIVADTTIDPPLAYLIPPQWTEAIELVKLHGLKSSRLSDELTLEVQLYRFTEVTFSSRSFEGRQSPKFKTQRFTQRRTFNPGTVVVPLDQPNAKVAVHLFEPDAPDSLVRWGFFNTIMEQKEYAGAYVLEELAREMLAADPALRTEFEQKVRTDREFASSARARLNFFYKRSPYWDEVFNVYPIARLTQPLTVTARPN